MPSRYLSELKRKYHVKVFDSVYCTSSCSYFAKAIITGGGKRDVRDIDLDGCRIMWKDKPFSYLGYPAYVNQSIADQLKEKLDEGELSVYELDQEGTRRYKSLRYHKHEYLAFAVDYNFTKYGSGASSSQST